jgi:replicative DNA helicase
MLSAANDIAKLAYQQDVSVNTALDGAEKSVFSISERRLTRDLQPIQQVLSDYYDRIDQLASRDLETYGVPSGFIDLDRLLGGMQPSDLLIIAGRPAMGKTGFLLSSGKNAAQLYKKHVAIFSLEMSNEQLVQRLIAQETGIDSQRLRTGQLAEDEWPLFTHAIEVLSDSHIFLDDTPAITPLQLRTKCRRLHMEYRLDLILVDYLQLMTGETRTENRVQEVSYISRNLKVLARELNVPVLAAAQLSRAVEQRADKRPMLSDLRESGCLAGDSLVELANGTHAPIKELVRNTGLLEVMALNEQTQRIEPAQMRKAWHTGRKPIFKLRTKLKKEICATANHKFRTMDGWMRLDQLAPGDLIAIPRAKVDTNPSAIEMNNEVDAEYLQIPGQRDIFWDRVISILGEGVEDVFDLEVKGHHNFTANDIIVHNSLEQDSDVVMFIYRPDQYEHDTLKQNIAEIIVAKHRNGPVGSVELVFRRNLAKFENAATRHVDLSKV